MLTAFKQYSNIVFLSCQFKSSESFFTTTTPSACNNEWLCSIFFYNSKLQFREIKRIVALFKNLSLHINEQVLYLNNNEIKCDFDYFVSKQNALLPPRLFTEIPSPPTIHFAFERQNRIHSCKLQNYLQLNFARNIFEELQEDSELQILEISNCNNKSDNIKLVIGTHISRQNVIECISLTDISLQLLSEICENLRHISSLKSFSISYITISDSKSFAKLLSLIITSNPLLEDFTISHCNIYGEILAKVTKALQSACSLKNLTLNGNLIYDVSVKQLASTLTSKNMELQRLQLSQHKIDVSSFEFLSMQHANLFDIGISMKALISENSSTSEISQVQMANCKFEDAELVVFFELLAKTSSLKAINVSSNWINDIVANKLAEVIKNNTDISCLNMLDCYVSNQGIATVLASLKNVLSLQSIMLNLKAHIKLLASSEESIDPFEMLSYVISDHKLLQVVILKNCTSDKVIDSLCSLSSLQLLDLSSSTVSSNNLASIIENNINLRYLDISHCKISQKHLVEVIDNTMQLCQLESLNLSGHLVTTDISNTLADTIIRNVKLKYFNISRCEFDNDGYIIIFKALKTVTCLSHFDVSYNSFGEPAANELVKLFQSFIAITYISLSHCEINDKYLCHLIKCLKELNFLRFLLINGSILNDPTIVDNLAAAISNKQFLQHLNLSGCRMSGNHLAKVAAALKQSLNLKYLNVSNNEVNDKASAEISSVINNSSSSLEHLHLNSCRIQEGGLKQLRWL